MREYMVTKIMFYAPSAVMEMQIFTMYHATYVGSALWPNPVFVRSAMPLEPEDVA